MKNLISVLCIIALVCISAVAYCAGPEDAVKGMFDAAKAGEWEKACSFMDLEGMAVAMKEMMTKMTEGMDDATKKQMEEQMGEMTDATKIKAKMIEQMEADETKKDFTYKIIEVKDKKEDSAIVVAEITEKDQKPQTMNFPVKKLKGKWLIDFAKMAPGAGMEEPVEVEPEVKEGETKEETPKDTKEGDKPEKEKEEDEGK
jgi:hypothetical protein